MNKLTQAPLTQHPLGTFEDRFMTADGQVRASVRLNRARTLWFNTGTLCNIECVNCYIESSPINDRLAYLDTGDMVPFLDQIKSRDWPVSEIGFTGGEPFVNPAIIDMVEIALGRGFDVLVLTNAMRPMMRPRPQAGLARLVEKWRDRLTLRVSLDHYTARMHDSMRGAGSFERSLEGMFWLRDTGIRMTVAARTLWGETETACRQGFADLYARHGFAVDAFDPTATVLFPEMDATVEVPEITTACWDILGKKPADVMCASSRMVIKHRGAARPVVQACTLLPYEPEFAMGETLEQAEREVYLNHRHCAKFCVLGGASCSA